MLKMKDLGSAEIDWKFCRELWDIRLKNINLKHEIDPEKDFEIFRRYFSDPSTRVMTFWDQEGNLQGFYGRNLKVIQIRGRSYLRVFLEYGFMNPQFRGRIEFIFSFVWLGLNLLVKFRELPKVAVGVAYPASYITCKRNFPGILNMNSLNLAEDNKEILTAFLKEFFEENYDLVRNRVQMRTLPIVPNRLSEDLKVHRALAEYEKLNPNWKEGYALPILFEVSLRSFGWLLKRFSIAPFYKMQKIWSW